MMLDGHLTFRKMQTQTAKEYVWGIKKCGEGRGDYGMKTANINETTLKYWNT